MVSPPQENTAVVRRFLTDVVAGGDIDALGISLADDAVSYQPVLEGRIDGKRDTYWCVLATADIDIAIDAVVAANDQVAVRGTITGIHRESLLDLMPAGRSFEIACGSAGSETARSPRSGRCPMGSATSSNSTPLEVGT